MHNQSPEMTTELSIITQDHILMNQLVFREDDVRESHWDVRKRRLLCQDGRTAIDNLETTWSSIIDAKSYTQTTIMVQEFVEDCGPNAFICEGSWHWVQKTVWIGTPDKHDGVVTVKATRWAANHSNEDLHNQHNPDSLMIGGKDHGGFNHFEIRNAKRNYTLPGVFNKGDVNPPMDRVADWIFDNRSNF